MNNTGSVFAGGREMLMKSKSRTTTKILPLLHPGEYLRSVLDDAGLSANAVALSLRVPANRLTEILKWAAGDHGGYRHALGALLRHVAANLGESAGEVRSGGGGRGTRGTHPDGSAADAAGFLIY